MAHNGVDWCRMAQNGVDCGDGSGLWGCDRVGSNPTRVTFSGGEVEPSEVGPYLRDEMRSEGNEVG